MISENDDDLQTLTPLPKAAQPRLAPDAVTPCSRGVSGSSSESHPRASLEFTAARVEPIVSQPVGKLVNPSKQKTIAKE